MRYIYEHAMDSRIKYRIQTVRNMHRVIFPVWSRYTHDIHSFAANSIIKTHYAFLFRKFSRASQSVHVHTLCCAGSIQDSFFLLRCRVIFGISAVHLAQLGNRQRWHMYLLLSLNIASSFGFKAVGFCLQSDDLHVNPRQILHVLHAVTLHGGCKQS